ncbi:MULTISPECIES: metal ABC transporter substrate-binding protein [unclassified Bacillus (in: firmicutes)]|uniref:metal ABC transporter substrate-binding protein n=1 Tax=unclassified Bacillus (in: firmicutes) TaxID=185979 RepID=UPI00227E2A83|nr:metal ABC transporter substrate-binding protein [Bacillus sp. S20C3]MCY8287535.1 metal ABC transporter substrate-binding protein [Bacillus sp. N13C7]MCY8638634.1 metal ABC transporter substrate-binding protein [Bacillus sp. S17B2]MCY8718862.1 metal ABC transporter substrate-binding protein [Bacillus sp. S10C12M]MCY9144652.1 metal ABC transporter substrate-binding protein [Bacillus sp. T9C1]
MFKKWSGLFVIAACFLLVAACGNSSTKGSADSKGDKLHIVTTFYPMYEFTKQIVKDKGDVDLLIPSSVEPHDWEPTPKDIANIQDADLFVYNSEYMESWVPSTEKSMGQGHAVFVNASKGIDLMEGSEEEHEEHGEHEEHEHGEHEHSHAMDPHVWLSPVLAQKEVKNITAQIVKQDPDNKEYYEKNSKEYIAKLQDLDKLYRTTVKKAEKKEFITQHTAFGYLAKEYGLTQVPIAGLSPDQEPSAADLAKLKTYAKEHNVKVIYFEEIASSKVADTLASEIGAKTEVLNTLEGLSKEEQDKGLGYIDIMKQNLDALKDSLLVKS